MIKKHEEQTMRRNQTLSSRSEPNLHQQSSDLATYVCDNNGVGYEIRRFLGKGGFAKCYLASSDNQEFALKVITKESIKKPSHLSKIKKEVYTHFKLHHPNIVALYATFEDIENIYMVLEYCPNGTLADYIEKTPGRFISESNAIVFLKQLLKAVKYLHTDCGILHRDIKPGNVLLSREFTVKLADFGFCCTIRELATRTTHTVCGTPNYVPMEVIEKHGHSVHSESWAIACTFFCMIYGKPPFHSDCLDLTYSRIRRCDYSFPKNYPVSAKAQDFIQRTLIPDRYKRLSIDAMLLHSLFSPNNWCSLHSSGLNSNNCYNEVLSKPRPITTQTTAFSPQLFSHNNKNKNALVDSGLGSELSGQTVQLIKSIFDRFIKGITSVLDPYDPTYLSPIKNAQLPPSFVAKWVDYTNKFGFGVTLKDGTRTLLFNDRSTIAVSHCDNQISYRRRKFDEDLLNFNINNNLPNEPYWINCPILSSNLELRDKVEILRYLRVYMDNELYSFVEMNEPPGDRLITPKIDHATHRLSRICKDLIDEDQPYLHRLNLDASRSSSSNGSGNSRPTQMKQLPQSNMAHIVDFRKLPDSLLMLMSDGTCQINFSESRYKIAMCISNKNTSSKQISSNDPSFLDKSVIKVFLITPKHQVYGYEVRVSYDMNKPNFHSNMTAHLVLFYRILRDYTNSQFGLKNPIFCSTDC